MPRHTALYFRVSSKSQARRNQRPELERWASHHDGPVVWYTDHAPGATTERPGWQKLWAAALAGEVERVVCWRMDRLGRTTGKLVELFGEMQRLKVDLVSLRDGFPGLDTPAGRTLTKVLASVAEYDREVTRARQAAGIAAARAAGKRWGGATNTGKRLHVTHEQAAMVRMLKAEGVSVSAIARAVRLSRPTVYSVLGAERGS